MKKTIILVLSVLLCALFLTSCATSAFSLEKGNVKSSTKRVKGADGIRQPEWVPSKEDDSQFYYSVGHALVGDRITSEKVAKMEAANELAARVQTEISRIQTYTSSANATEVSMLFTERSEQIANAMLVGIAYIDTWVGQDESIYVLASIPRKNLEKAVEDILNEVTVNDLKLLVLTEEQTEEKSSLIDKIKAKLGL
ncbi:MAG: LPP20 family lipoprotein [Sphaerochaetaceae bacterium]|nr:LPP20 family lipoprotein [Sphaerochaetaceae bacterium]